MGGFIFNGGQPDITFAQPTPRGASFLLGLQQRATGAKLYTPDGTLNEGWGNLTKLVEYPHNVVVPSWAVFGPPTSRPLAPRASKNMANMTSLGLWQQLQKNAQQNKAQQVPVVQGGS